MLQSLQATNFPASEIMIVTHEDTLADPTFALALRAADPDPTREYHVATVNRQGDFRLTLLSPAGRKPLCSASLRLEDLLSPGSPKRAPAPLVDRSIDPSLPAIFSVHPFPLLLPHVVDPARATYTKKSGLIAVTTDGRLLHWTSQTKGARQLVPATPPGKLLGVFVDDDAQAAAVVTHHASPRQPARLHVQITSIDDGDSATYSLGLRPPLHVTLHAGTILFIYRRSVLAFNAEARAFHPQPLRLDRQSYWCGGRFFHGNSGYWAAAFNGSTIELHKLTDHSCVLLFDRQGHGPWQLFQDGRAGPVDQHGQVSTPPIPNPIGGRSINVYSHLTRVSAGGDRILTHLVPGVTTYYLDLESDEDWQTVRPHSQHLLLGPGYQWSNLSGVHVRNHFASVGVADAGDLVLLKCGQRVVIHLSPTNQLALDARIDHPATRAVPFGPRRRAPGARFWLREARWPDGSRALLDSRGLLHLQSADRSLPEISLVLSGGIAGWTSDGHTFGWAYFHSDPPTVQAPYVYDLLKRFTARLR
jgi:hypothetical protein